MIEKTSIRTRKVEIGRGLLSEFWKDRAAAVHASLDYLTDLKVPQDGLACN